MFNAYAVIIVLFIAAGLGAALWGGLLLARARRTQRWPAVEGRIEVSEPQSPENDLLPLIEYSYQVQGRSYRRRLEFPAGTFPQTPDFAAAYVRKYPVGRKVQVYVNPDDPQEAVLERGDQGGDWLILLAGLGAVILGLLMLFL